MSSTSKALLAAALAASWCGGTAAPAQTNCGRYSLENLSLGLTFPEVKRAMSGRSGTVQTVVDAGGATSTVTYAKPPASVVVQFDQDVTKSPQARVRSITRCVPQDLTTMAAVVENSSSRFGEPASRSPEAGADPAEAPAAWRDPPCGVEARAYPKAGEWWSGTAGTICVELRSVPVLERQPPVAPPPETVAAPPRTEPEPARPAVAESPAVETAAETAAPEPPPAAGAVTRPPELIRDSYVHPKYPAMPRGLRGETQVLLKAVVRRDGTVGDVGVLQSSRPNLGFEEAAIDAVRKWRYRPGTRDGEVVEMPVVINVVFR